jgi:hypothetical protein
MTRSLIVCSPEVRPATQALAPYQVDLHLFNYGLGMFLIVADEQIQLEHDGY